MPDTPPPPPPVNEPKSGRWGDLGPRVLSGIVLIVIVTAELWAGGVAWWSFVFIVWSLMLWELGPLCAPGLATWRRVALAATPVLLSILLAIGNLTGAAALAPVAMLLPAALGLVLLPSGRLIWGGYVLMMTAGVAYLILSFGGGEGDVWPIVSLIVLVAISDTLGYFAGRTLGGPKFWPRVSPKKTWSGTVAGWIGAALFGASVFPWLLGTEWTVAAALAGALVAVVLAFAGQMGDIAESAIKRRAGVKDASNLIPGHGGFLDRLDALIAAAAAALVLTFLQSTLAATP